MTTSANASQPRRASGSTTLAPGWWLKKWRVAKALKHYPSAYSPPHRKQENALPAKEVEENFQYFMATRHERVEALFEWLDHYFPGKPSEDRLERLLKFIDDYRGVLVPSINDPTVFTYTTYELPWEGPQAWASLVFDLSTALGELVLERRPGGHWATEWDNSVVPDYRSWFDKDTLELLDELGLDPRKIERPGRPMVVWPGDGIVPFFDIHPLMESELRRCASGALLAHKWQDPGSTSKIYIAAETHRILNTPVPGKEK